MDGGASCPSSRVTDSVVRLFEVTSTRIMTDSAYFSPYRPDGKLVSKRPQRKRHSFRTVLFR